MSPDREALTCTGSRLAKTCRSGSRYLELIDACVDSLLASLPAFLATYEANNVCHGQVIDNLVKLEGLRYCHTMDAGLTITVSDENADFSAMFDIRLIQGTPPLLFFMFMLSGPLVVRGSSMVSLSAFAHLLAVDASSRALAEVNGGMYSVAVYGLLASAMHSSFFADNSRLKDFGNILEIQAKNDNGTYVTDNDVLCFLSSLFWTQRANSNISYRLDQVA